MLYNIIITVIVIVSALLTIVVLLQPGQGQGISGGITGGGGVGGSGGLGARRAADLLSKSTTILATALLVLSLLANFTIERQSRQPAVQESDVQNPANGVNNPSQTAPAVPNNPDQNNSNSGDGGNSGGGEEGGN